MRTIRICGFVGRGRGISGPMSFPGGRRVGYPGVGYQGGMLHPPSRPPEGTWDHRYHTLPEQYDTRVKTLPSGNFVGGR